MDPLQKTVSFRWLCSILCYFSDNSSVFGLNQIISMLSQVQYVKPGLAQLEESPPLCRGANCRKKPNCNGYCHECLGQILQFVSLIRNSHLQWLCLWHRRSTARAHAKGILSDAGPSWRCKSDGSQQSLRTKMRDKM